MSAKNDQQLLAEAYQEIQEGILRRAASRVAGVAKKIKGLPGSAKGVGRMAAGKVGSGLGSLVGSETAKTIGAEAQQSGREDLAAAKEKGSGGKAEHFKTSLLAEIKKDVESLGVAEDVNGFMADITDVLNKHIPSGEQSFVSTTVDQFREQPPEGAQKSPATLNNSLEDANRVRLPAAT